MPVKSGLHPKIRTVNKNPSCCRIRTTTGGIRYAKTIYKIEQLSDEIFRLKTEGKTHRQIGEIYGLTKEQIKGFIKRQRRKDRLRKAGYIPRPKGRPRKQAIDERTSLQNEVIELRMKVDVLRNFLCEVGRR